MKHTTRARRWTIARRLADRLFPRFVPGRHHNLASSLVALMEARELRP